MSAKRLSTKLLTRREEDQLLQAQVSKLSNRRLLLDTLTEARLGDYDCYSNEYRMLEIELYARLKDWLGPEIP